MPSSAPAPGAGAAPAADMPPIVLCTPAAFPGWGAGLWLATALIPSVPPAPAWPAAGSAPGAATAGTPMPAGASGTTLRAPMKYGLKTSTDSYSTWPPVCGAAITWPWPA